MAAKFLEIFHIMIGEDDTVSYIVEKREIHCQAKHFPLNQFT